jgi:peptidoglycan/LPS O-acetylase OafA/YrhL
VGDYSYGFYIYAFPVQQAVVALIPDVSVLEMVLIAVPVVLLLSALSWHLLEKRVLTLKERYVQRTRAWLGAAPAE